MALDGLVFADKTAEFRRKRLFLRKKETRISGEKSFSTTITGRNVEVSIFRGFEGVCPVLPGKVNMLHILRILFGIFVLFVSLNVLSAERVPLKPLPDYSKIAK